VIAAGVTYSVTDTHVAGAVTMNAAVDLQTSNLFVDAGGVLTVNGKTLDIGGNLTVTISQAGVSPNFVSAGDGLKMTNVNDRVNVAGSATFTAIAYHFSATSAGNFSAGVLSVGGNFTSTHNYQGASNSWDTSFISTGTKVVLNGTVSQAVSFTLPSVTRSRFSDLEISNAVGVSLSSAITITGSLSSPATIVAKLLSSGQTITVPGAANIGGLILDNTTLVLSSAPTLFDNVTFQNYTATPLLLNFSGATGASALTFNNLNYSTALPAGQFHIGGTGTGNTITINGTNLATGTEQFKTAVGTFTSHPYPNISIAAASVAEGSGGGTTTLNLTVTLATTATQNVSVDYATSDGTALAASDYTATTATVTISAGQLTGTIPVLVNADNLFEADETLNVTISNPVHTIITTAAAVGTILNDDVGAGGVNDTGVTTWSNATVNNLTVTQAAFPVQDADVGRDALATAGTLPAKTGAGNAGFDFTKLDANGASLPAASTAWSCVQDNVTGLTWEVKTAANAAYTYTWFDSNAASNVGTPGMANGGVCVDTIHCDTEKYVAAMNTAAVCGFTDWRVPKMQELRSIVDYGVGGGALIDAGYFPNTTGQTWTSNTYPANGAYALYMNFGDGASFYRAKSTAYNLRLVRGTP